MLLPQLNIRHHQLIPIVQGAMGSGISASKLSSAVAREHGMGTIASVNLFRLHPDLLTESRIKPSQKKYDVLNRIALDREIKSALALSEGRGMIAVNIMKSLPDYTELVRQACESGAQAITVGAGLPLDLPQLTQNHPNVALIPILSEPRGIKIVLKRWLKNNRLPDAIIIEHPAYQAQRKSHFSRSNNHFDFPTAIEQTFDIFNQLGLEDEKIPLIIAGGMGHFDKIVTALTQWGASGVQIGSAFSYTQECDALVNFKQWLASNHTEKNFPNSIISRLITCRYTHSIS